MNKVNRIWAFIGLEEGKDEGILALTHNDVTYSLATTDESRLKELRDVVESFSASHLMPIELREFELTKVIEVYEPESPRE